MYSGLKYNSKSRWLSYWYQINETVSRNPENILIIGKGSGIVEKIISVIASQIKTVVLDIEPGLLPDIMGDIKNLPIKDAAFDCILCCQVLEHLPFEGIPVILNEFNRVVKDFAVVSVPQKRKYIKIEVDAPLIGHHLIIMKNPFTKRTISSKQHHWEINRGVSFKEVKRTFEQVFSIEKTFLNEVNCNHRFFILRKR